MKQATLRALTNEIGRIYSGELSKENCNPIHAVDVIEIFRDIHADGEESEKLANAALRGHLYTIVLLATGIIHSLGWQDSIEEYNELGEILTAAL